MGRKKVHDKATKVIRISHNNYEKIKNMLNGRTFDLFFTMSLPLWEKPIYYYVNNKLFDDIKMARGEAIMDRIASRRKELEKILFFIKVGEE